MTPVGFALMVVAVLIGYEALKLIRTSSGASAATPTSSPPLITNPTSPGPSPSPGSGGNAGPSVRPDYATLAQQHSQITGIPPSIYTSVIQSESGGYAADNALFGIQGQGHPYQDIHPNPFGPDTLYGIRGNIYNSSLQTYPSANDAFNAFDALSLKLAGPVNGDPRGWLHRLNQANYAEDQTWWEKILRAAGI